MDWFDMIAEASKLETPEVWRHARVSLNNKHRCRSCFTCACVEVLKQRKEIAIAAGLDPTPYDTRRKP